MNEEEQEKLYELLFKDTKNKLEETIEEQQKEIEELQIIADDIKGHNIVYIDTPEFEEKYISKDKIKAKIKELEDNMILFTNDKEKFNRYKYSRNILEKLLEE